MAKRKSNWLSQIKLNLYEYDMLPHYEGEYLLEEEVWEEAGLYMTSDYNILPRLMEDEELVGIVDKFIGRIMK